MTKILIGWLARQNDFIKPDTKQGRRGSVNKNGPNYQFHQHFYRDYDEHIMLYSDEEQMRNAGLMQNAISKDFPDHKVSIKLVEISNPVDLFEIKPKVEAVLLDRKEDEIDIFFSPGTSIMQVSWVICHTSLSLKTRLIQTVGSRDTKDGKPKMMLIELGQSAIPYSSTIKQQGIEKRDKGDEGANYKITDSIKPVYERADKIAQTDKVSCLINGPTGTGKEHLAKYIFLNSPRKEKAFYAMNCSALSDDLLESRLFGHRKGAFTGADADYEGVFKQAHRGTVFLDEIGDISPKLQQSMLRLLQEGEIQPINGEIEKVDIRIIAATNKDLVTLCKDGDFRWDLYYRLAVTELEMPSLLKRGPEEIDEMFEFFLDSKKSELNKHTKIKPNAGVIQFVKNYAWPGNVRELENFVENLYVFNEEKVGIEDIPERFKREPEVTSLKADDVLAVHIKKVLKIKRGNKRQTSIALGWVENTLKKWMDKYGINVEDYR